MKIVDRIDQLPWHPNRVWQKREISSIKKIIIHQELGNSNVKGVNKYHISPNHISKRGCPHFCYHFGIEKDGTIIQANSLKDITWHATNHNSNSVGIMLVGNFKGKGYDLGVSGPNNDQLKALEFLVKGLLSDLDLSYNNVYGHSDFGKPACPGYATDNWISDFKRRMSQTRNLLSVNEMQTILKSLNLYDGKIDNDLNMETIAAIKEFQFKHGLTPNGFADDKTCDQLRIIRDY
ncbi:MAG: N-acetylmuramoyl-L-alanine amidase [Bacteroidales bacterium]|jgi:N-acetyl-anhydromuramyl-L-alanine amidase AmpD|nr:N-acetylmuramoyl-L-alanine amidase [Bacteroidales bacterium]